MADIGWTFDDGSTTASVRLTTPINTKRAEALSVYPVIGRSDPRVIASGNFSTETTYGLVALSSEDDANMETVCNSGAVITVTGPNSEVDYVRIKDWSRVAVRPSLVLYTLSTVRSI